LAGAGVYIYTTQIAFKSALDVVVQNNQAQEEAQEASEGQAQPEGKTANWETYQKNIIDSTFPDEQVLELEIVAEPTGLESLIIPGNEIYETLFEQYKVLDEFSGTPASLDFSSDPGALHFQTRITDGYNAYDPSNRRNIFAGHYIFTMWGCGTSCKGGVIVDLKDGKIYSIPGGEGDAYPEWKYYFVENSSLLIVNPISATRCISETVNDSFYCPPTQFYLWEDGQFKKLLVNQKEMIKQFNSDLNSITADWQTHTYYNYNENYKFEIKYPKNWNAANNSLRLGPPDLVFCPDDLTVISDSGINCKMEEIGDYSTIINTPMRTYANGTIYLLCYGKDPEKYNDSNYRYLRYNNGKYFYLFSENNKEIINKMFYTFKFDRF